MNDTYDTYKMKLDLLANTDSACEWARTEIDRLQRHVAELEAARRAYASEFVPNAEGEPDVGSIHQNIRNLKGALRSIKVLASNHATAHGIAVSALKNCCGETHTNE